MKTYHILHLDENVQDAETVRAELKVAVDRFQVESVQNRQRFETRLKEISFDLVISAHTLRDYDILAALAFARSLNQDLPFVLVSAILDEDRVVELLRAGVADFVFKPSLERLLPTLF